MANHDLVLYWDTSAILSALFEDSHSDKAQKWAKTSGFHLMSTLAHAEACAVIVRMEREHILRDRLAKDALRALREGPWRALNTTPQWSVVEELAVRCQLRGADLWHLALAKTLQDHLPEISVLTFDKRLRDAVEAEGLST